MSLGALMSSFTGAGTGGGGSGAVGAAAAMTPVGAALGALGAIAGTPNTSASGLTSTNKSDAGGVSVGGLAFGNTGGQDWIKYLVIGGVVVAALYFVRK